MSSFRKKEPRNSTLNTKWCSFIYAILIEEDMIGKYICKRNTMKYKQQYGEKGIRMPGIKRN